LLNWYRGYAYGLPLAPRTLRVLAEGDLLLPAMEHDRTPLLEALDRHRCKMLLKGAEAAVADAILLRSSPN